MGWAMTATGSTSGPLPRTERTRFEPTGVIHSPAVTHIRYRAVK
jgi:hypothetical protein